VCWDLWSGPLPADAPGQLHVPGHDGHSLRVDGAQVRVLEEADEVGLGGLLDGLESGGLVADVDLVFVGDLPHEPLERQPPQEQLGGLLVPADLPQRDRPGAEPMRLLDAPRRRLGLAGRLGDQLLPGRLAPRALPRRLLGPGQGLLGRSSTSSSKAMIFVAGTCAVTLFAAVNASDIALFSSTSSAQASTVSQQAIASYRPVPVVSTQLTAVPEAGEASVNAVFEERTWPPMISIAAFPLAVAGFVAALSKLRQSAQAVDPMDMVGTSSSTWALAATSGESAVAKNYANALVDLGKEGNCLEQLHTDVDSLRGILADEAFAAFLNNPLFAGDKQKDVILKVAEEANMSQVTKNFLCFLVDKKRIAQLPLIVREFDEQYYEVTGTQVATVTAAIPLSEDQLRLIANKLHEMTKGKNIKIKSQVNSDLLAGFILEYGKSGSQRIDLSLRGQLDELRGDLQEGVKRILSAGVPAGAQVMAAAVGINALLAENASAGSGKIFDFGLTMPIQMIQFLLLMVFLDKVVFTPVGKMIDERAVYIRSKNSAGADNSKEIAALNAQAEALLDAARKEAAKDMEAARKEAATVGGERMAKAKAELDATLKRSLAELESSKKELWSKLEADVLPVLTDDIVGKLLQEESSTAAVGKQ